jgi:hypothetical protein
MKLVDVIKNPEYTYLLSEIEKNSALDQHRNSKNYSSLSEMVKNSFISYELLLDEQSGEVVAGSGLQKYTSTLARVASRTYIMQKYRKPSGAALPICESIFVPYEISIAKEHGIHKVFFSIELYRRRNAVRRFCKNLMQYGMEFTMHPDMINTCRMYISNGNPTINQQQPCWQNGAFYTIIESNETTTLPSISVEEYVERYYSEEKYRLC